MNAVFHVSLGLASSLLFAGGIRRADDKNGLFEKQDTGILTAGFSANILLHGLLDVAPHTYPIVSVYDLMIASFLIFAAVFFTRMSFKGIVFVCALGAVFPDLVDLGPALLNQFTGTSLPEFKFFPWHWASFQKYKSFDPGWSLVCHTALFMVIAGVMLLRRGFVKGRRFFN
ncbi:MAG: hypothetical protein A2Y33_02260 [Spirochaetes bacterium GWF1_51_8]|nr:MAG: hypothetical protein A2Y33_02260 [Spirochaetes bacterium GWF1_51_8]